MSKKSYQTEDEVDEIFIKGVVPIKTGLTDLMGHRSPPMTSSDMSRRQVRRYLKIHLYFTQRNDKKVIITLCKSGDTTRWVHCISPLYDLLYLKRGCPQKCGKM